MELISVRIITTDVKRLMSFYEQVTEGQATFYTPDFAELKTGTATLAIGSTRTMQAFGQTEIAKPAHNQSAIIEFKVGSVDESYARISTYIQSYLVQEPTTMPWGNRSLLFRDPDGNLVNFFTPVSQAAIEKFGDNS